MLSNKIDNLLILLEKTEKTISNIYGSFSLKKNFPSEVKDFWASMMKAELEHAKLFKTIREKVNLESSVTLEINFDLPKLQSSFKKLQILEKQAPKSKVSQTKAYSIGALIEEGLFEFSYSKRIKSNSKEIMKYIKKVENDTKQHYVSLHNYSLEKKAPIKRK